MTADWFDRVDSFWAAANDADPIALLESMRRLVEERPEGDARALVEWASVHDFLGLEREAVPIYRAARTAGLDDDHDAQAVVQLASSLRKSGEPQAAVELLRSLAPSTSGAAPRAFLALALHDTGYPTEALKVALLALAPTLPRSEDAVREDASALG